MHHNSVCNLSCIKLICAYNNCLIKVSHFHHTITLNEGQNPFHFILHNLQDCTQNCLQDLICIVCNLSRLSSCQERQSTEKKPLQSLFAMELKKAVCKVTRTLGPKLSIHQIQARVCTKCSLILLLKEITWPDKHVLNIKDSLLTKSLLEPSLMWDNPFYTAIVTPLIFSNYCMWWFGGECQIQYSK